ncbi:hypothetical protein [Segetibacter aerophilus]|uniref:TonB-dependent receptor n=1 Tax=Segetibacter aerophilus TaxID=670293 RepID=A0A512B7K5_9BACT|nr:hypothetical protein [Segetibacter aerophilus]GEO07940.1 hypothetical protein SAE01_04360 [Segetibacter aerophilus]
MKKLLLILFSIVSLSSVHAQKDTTKKTVVVTSAYKPVLKPAAKINFSAAVPSADSSRPPLTYNVPAQNLFFSYQPAALKPLALSIDTSFSWENSNFVKLGVGSYTTPFAQLGLSFGDGRTSLVNVHARHISQKGSLPLQQYSRTNADVSGIFSGKGNIEWHGKAGVDLSNQYYYGYSPDTLKYSKDSLKQRFKTLSAMIGFRNKEVNSYGITYDPTLSVNFFADNRKGKEANLVLNAPVTKTFNEDLAFNVEFTADITSYHTYSSRKITNNLYYLSPSVGFKKPTFSVNAGITPSWDNKEFKLLPNFTALIKMQDERFVLQGGWIGYYQKNTFQSLAAFNPWIAQPNTLLNTRIIESYAGFKGSAGSHFTFNAKLSALKYTNAALFTNDFVDGKTFQTVYEPSMRALKIHGEAGYTAQEKFSFLGGITISKYSALKENSKAWGLVPLELTGALRWQVLKDLQFKSDVFLWDGAQFVTKGGVTTKPKSAYDLNAGVEFTIMPKLNLWLQFNNILNNKYQRWNQYQVLGFNVIGGIVYSFSQPGK